LWGNREIWLNYFDDYFIAEGIIAQKKTKRLSKIALFGLKKATRGATIFQKSGL